MIVVESFPLFRTKTPAGAVGVVAETQQPAQRPPLPKALWITGIVAFAEARTVQRALAKTYLTACGLAEDGFWYVASPSSGLTAKVVNSG